MSADTGMQLCKSSYEKDETALLQQARLLAAKTEDALRGGVTLVQLREKECAKSSYIKIAQVMINVCRKYDVPLIIDDDIDVAIDSGADGVHIGQCDGDVSVARKRLDEASFGNKERQRKILGVSAQTVEEAIKAERDGADYLGVGAVFATGTKKDADSVSAETLSQICRSVSIPVVAIGGITADNCASLFCTGIAGISVVSAIYAQNDAKAAAEKLYSVVEKSLNKNAGAE